MGTCRGPVRSFSEIGYRMVAENRIKTKNRQCTRDRSTEAVICGTILDVMSFIIKNLDHKFDFLSNHADSTDCGCCSSGNMKKYLLTYTFIVFLPFVTPFKIKK
ncbi:hypothetical protein XENOCAPTIV_007639 [Xenoophorus captivus]|uniref:Uncharacterized protein n=1 Tax=Xenoophorus captivus TaxID=1517983 RepID=A0ABV0SEV2_9TELE